MKFGLLIACFCVFAFADNESPWRPAVTPHSAGEEGLSLFAEIAKIPRPSKGEKAVRQFILDKAQALNAKVWGNSLKICADAYGNAEIQLPATGKYASMALPSIALQSHLDMVWTAKGAAPQSDLTPYFADGVKLSETNGWLHSQGYVTTLGADDGAGISMELRYLENPELAHPALDLLFTVEEEIGVSGAANFTCPLTAPALVNLDNENEGEFAYGSQGIYIGQVAGILPNVSVPNDYSFLKLSVTNLKGGHSGENIALNRANAILATAKGLKDYFASTGIPFEISSAVGGNADNAIPNSAEFTVAVPTAKLSVVESDLKKQMIGNLGSYQDEAFSKGAAADWNSFVKVAEVKTSASRVLAPEQSQLILNALLSAKNGVVVSADGFPKNVETSSNIGLFKIEAVESGTKLETNFAARTFTQSHLDELVKTNQTALSSPFPGKFTIGKEVRLAAWFTDPNSSLYQLAKKRFPNDKFVLVPGGLETSGFIMKRPGIQMLSFGPTIKFPHSSDEQLDIASFDRTVEKLQSLIEAIAEQN